MTQYDCFVFDVYKCFSFYKLSSNDTKLFNIQLSFLRLLWFPKVNNNIH